MLGELDCSPSFSHILSDPHSFRYLNVVILGKLLLEVLYLEQYEIVALSIGISFVLIP
jgi:hypothetical protein